MQQLRERLRETVGERLDHDRAVVVVVRLIPRDELVDADAGRHREATEGVLQLRLRRRDEVGERAVRAVVAVVGLLPEHREQPAAVEHDVVSASARRPEPVDPLCGDRPVAHDLVEQLGRLPVQLPRGLAVLRMVEDLREPALELPSGEEERPVDERPELLERRLHDARTGERRRRDVLRAPDRRRPVLHRPRVGE